MGLNGRRPIRVLVVDDHGVVRHGLHRVLEGNEDIEVAGEAATMAEALIALRTVDPDVLLLDWCLPDGDADTLLYEINRRGHRVSTVVLTGFGTSTAVQKAMDGGAVGFLAKATADGDGIAEAIRGAQAGRVSLSPDALAALRSEGCGRDSGPFSDLTTRETEVLRLVAQGLTNAQIGSVLFISERTVKYHVRNILAKAQASTRTELVALAHRWGLAASA